MSQLLGSSGGGGGGGVTSVTGTANQVTASPTTGAVVVSTPATFIAPGSIASTTTNSAGTQFLAANGSTSAPAYSFTSTPSIGLLYVNAGEFDVNFSAFNQTVRFLSTQTVFQANLVISAGGVADFFNNGGNYFNVTAPGVYPYTTTGHDYLVIVDTSSARTINLKANPASGLVQIIKDNTGSAGANNITVSGNGQNIDGAGSKTISTNFGVLQLQYNGTQWNIVSAS